MALGELHDESLQIRPTLVNILGQYSLLWGKACCGIVSLHANRTGDRWC